MILEIQPDSKDSEFFNKVRENSDKWCRVIRALPQTFCGISKRLDEFIIPICAPTVIEKDAEEGGEAFANSSCSKKIGKLYRYCTNNSSDVPMRPAAGMPEQKFSLDH